MNKDIEKVRGMWDDYIKDRMVDQIKWGTALREARDRMKEAKKDSDFALEKLLEAGAQIESARQTVEKINKEEAEKLEKLEKRNKQSAMVTFADLAEEIKHLPRHSHEDVVVLTEDDGDEDSWVRASDVEKIMDSWVRASDVEKIMDSLGDDRK